jgi:hypothetical protein
LSFWKSLATWTATLAVAVLGYSVPVELAQGRPLLVGQLASALPGLVSGLLPLTVFAAARHFGGQGQGRALWISLAIVALLSYGLEAGLDPQIQHRQETAGPATAVGYGSLGPSTPLELSKRKRYIVAHPPERYSFDVDRPLATPPNWLDFLIHSPVAFSLFVILNGCLGAVLGRRYSGRNRSAARRLWLFGILSGASFMIPAIAAGDYVQASLSASGMAAAWLPLALPLLALLVCMRLFPCPPGEDDEHRSDEAAPARKS